MTSPLIMEQPGELPVELVWLTIQALLKEQLGPNVAVDCIGQKDFDEQGAVTINPPAARVLFAGEGATSLFPGNQNYDAAQNYAVICCDQDLGPDPQDQRVVSVRLAGRVKHCLTGAVLALDNGQRTEPVVYAGMGVLPTDGTGMAYVVAFQVPGVAQFVAPNQGGFQMSPGGVE